MIPLVYENHAKWLNVTPVQHFCSGFDHENLFSVVPNIYQKLDSISNVYFFEYEHLKHFV